MSKDLMLLTGGHPVHVAFGEAVGATPYRISDRATKSQPPPIQAFNLLKYAFSLPSGYDTMLCESCYYYPAMKRRLFLLGKTKIVNMNSSPLFHFMISGRIGGIEKDTLLNLLKEVDGHLVLGTYGMETLRRFDAEKPARIVYPFVSQSFLSRLQSVQPALDSKTVTIIATTDPHNKGLDLVFEAMKEVYEHEPEARLNLITRMGEAEIKKIPGYDAERTRTLQNIENVAEQFANSSLYLQPSRCDMFPIGCIEAFAAGLPGIVSLTNGAKEVARKVDKEMVVPLDSGRLAEAILSYFSKSPGERKELSGKARAAASFFNEKDMIELFKNEYELLKNEL